MKLKKGQKIPDFEVQTIENERLKDIDLIGQKTLISFYRYSSCMLCNLRIRQIAKKYPEWNKKGLRVIAVSQSSTRYIVKHMQIEKIPFDVATDPRRSLFKKFGVQEYSFFKTIIGLLRMDKLIFSAFKGFTPGWVNGSFTLVPADFLVDENLIVQELHYGRDISDHISFKKIQAFVDN